MASEFLEGTRDVEDTMAGVAGELAYLAKAFAVTGNTKVSDQLYSMSEALVTKRALLQDLVNDKVMDDCRASERATEQLLAGVMGGMMVGGKSGPMSPEMEGMVRGMVESAAGEPATAE